MKKPSLIVHPRAMVVPAVANKWQIIAPFVRHACRSSNRLMVCLRAGSEQSSWRGSKITNSLPGISDRSEQIGSVSLRLVRMFGALVLLEFGAYLVAVGLSRLFPG